MKTIVNIQAKTSKWASLPMQDKRVYIGYYAIVLMVVMLFFYTALIKFADYNLFVFQMKLAPAPYMDTIAPVLGWLVPAVEALVVIAMALNRTRLYGLLGTIILMAVFNGYIITMLLSGHDLPCTCGGIISTLSWKAHLLFNFTILALCCWAVKNNSRITKMEKHKNEL